MASKRRFDQGQRMTKRRFIPKFVRGNHPCNRSSQDDPRDSIAQRLRERRITKDEVMPVSSGLKVKRFGAVICGLKQLFVARVG